MEEGRRVWLDFYKRTRIGILRPRSTSRVGSLQGAMENPMSGTKGCVASVAYGVNVHPALDDVDVDVLRA